MANRIDFTNCKRIIGRAYNGANGKKIAVEYEGERYMANVWMLIPREEEIATESEE